jgi:hypothetical protein
MDGQVVYPYHRCKGAVLTDCAFVISAPAGCLCAGNWKRFATDREPRVNRKSPIANSSRPLNATNSLKSGESRGKVGPWCLRNNLSAGNGRNGTA